MGNLSFDGGLRWFIEDTVVCRGFPCGTFKSASVSVQPSPLLLVSLCRGSSPSSVSNVFGLVTLPFSRLIINQGKVTKTCLNPKKHIVSNVKPSSLLCNPTRLPPSRLTNSTWLEAPKLCACTWQTLERQTLVELFRQYELPSSMGCGVHFIVCYTLVTICNWLNSNASSELTSI
jgi:hypothetical protein